MITKNDIISSFNPNAPGLPGRLFGLPFDEDHAELIILPVPWEVTVSYNAGTAEGPAAILNASNQVDLFLKDIPGAWQMGMYMLPISENLLEENYKSRDLAFKYISWLEQNDQGWISDDLKVIPRAVDEVCEKLNIYVKSQALMYLRQGKMVGLVGGDHSTPLGLIRAVAETFGSFGILQVDAHADLRQAYEDFRYSHASIMYNAMQLEQVSKLVQVGVRDYCEEEVGYINNSNGRVVPFFDSDIKAALYQGDNWASICHRIVQELPEKVYLSLDIDGLNPTLCPNTGTPVPGGLEFDQVIYLIKLLVQAKKVIIGFDINEVAPGDDDWDANVGARLLYNIGSLMGASQGRLKFIGNL